jgi:uncharacterized damage-inducible protein DinB
MIAMTSEDLLRWNEGTTSIWKEHLRSRPELLTYPCDIRGGQTVADLLQHIVAVELRYAERLNSEPETPYDQIPKTSIDLLYETHDRAVKKLRKLDDEADGFWNERIHFETRSGRFGATRRVIFAHCLLHSIRHYAQLATLLRKENAGISASFDYLAFGEQSSRSGSEAP